ncbi:beta-glucosidase 13-like [Macadamia integrifolia]|uniref:beta-glucosidase 13-like n=1 Tax=Macadamia integrifolia TaxID=60698 RepID=UPI001C4F3214|nr:beta-glucosidase 13-like [Macadamia integrifolia]
MAERTQTNIGEDLLFIINVRQWPRRKEQKSPMAMGSFPIHLLHLGFLMMVIITANSLSLLAHRNWTVSTSHDSASFNRSSFPVGFIFGTASSAYQYEGGAKEDGKRPSIWDVFTRKYPGKIRDLSNGDVAIDFYHRYKEDVAIMKGLGLDAFRFSISWSRVIPHGKVGQGINKKGVQYYNHLINELLSKGIKPFVTLLHWDLPQALEDEYGGFLSPRIIDDFQDYAELCFKEFGDRVKHWITLNEPVSFSYGGYNLGIKAPGRCSKWVGNCTSGNSATEPYLVTHHQLLAHAAAVKAYKDKYKASQKGKIGITLDAHWIMPYSNDISNKAAAKRALDFMFGWFMQPLTYGDYPQSMRSLVGNRLPKFSIKQSKMVKGSLDFIGLNYFTTNYAANVAFSNATKMSYSADSHTNITTSRNGIPIGPRTASDWLLVYPRGIWKFLLYTKQKYNNPTIYITENGISEFNNSTQTLEEALADNRRIDYYYHHLLFLNKAIKEGVDVRGYFAWSLLDNFEWDYGYTVRFGINYVDYKNGLKRYPKHSAFWFKRFLQR